MSLVTVKKQSFGKTVDGNEVHQYILKNKKGMEISVINYGGIITSWKAKDRDGIYQDIVLGFDNIYDYKSYTKQFDEVIPMIETSKIKLDEIINSFESDENKNKINEISLKNENIKKFQEEYASSYSKNQSNKNESIKRNERIKTIETEIESWINLLTNSEKMVTELNARKNKLSEKLNKLETEPQTQAEKKGQISESLRTSEIEKQEDEITINEIDKK